MLFPGFEQRLETLKLVQNDEIGIQRLDAYFGQQPA